MVAELIIALEAEQDIAEAYGWYESYRSGLGEEFLRCVDACIQQVRRTPEIHAQVHETYRRAMVRRFPYAIFYEYAERTMTVYCVFHTARDPGKWRQRLR
ncbi:MAG: type II toxin-antitoxin system RelE/ParE family toxin [Planctomycetes bacterium]|nr:type II toxin-antitoxin system RelE/ParE family toxin [Planctomycetota bacterium]